MPFWLALMQVIDFPTEIAVFGIALMIAKSAPKILSISSIFRPVTVEIMVCFFGFTTSFISSNTVCNCFGCTEMMTISEDLTAFLFSVEILTFGSFSQEINEDVSLFVRYKCCTLKSFCVKIPIAMEYPKFPAPMIAIFMCSFFKMRLLLNSTLPIHSIQASNSYFEWPALRLLSVNCRSPM